MRYLLCFILILMTPLLVFGSSASSQTIDRQEMEHIVQDFLADKSDLLPHVELSYKSIILPEPILCLKDGLIIRLSPQNRV